MKARFLFTYADPVVMEMLPVCRTTVYEKLKTMNIQNYSHVYLTHHLSGFVLLLTSYIGSPSAGPVVRATCASFDARTLKCKAPDVTGLNLYSSLSSVVNSVEKQIACQ
jgi:hypothetical protein